eukprot:gene6534-biopygen5320
MEDTGEDKKIEEESCTDVQEGATHIAYYGPVINIASGEAPITIGNIEQGTTRTYDTVGTVLENVSGNSEVTTGPTTFTSSSLQDVNGDKEVVVSKPQSANAFSGLREKYQKDCSTHEVNCIDTMENCIISLDLDINDFSVTLKIVEEEKRYTAKDKGYHGELEKHLHLLKDDARAIKVGELMNMIEDKEKERIMFVSGLAGIGKSVLAKKVALDWACKECSQTRCLFYITCRELNSFFRESGRDRKPEILIDEYLKEQFGNMPLENVETTVFLIDGLDELQEPVKIMKAFTEKFSKSRFIILGRPHARHHVNSIGQKSQKLEILGLNDDQIEEYIKNFVRFSFIKKTSFEEDDELSYQLVEKLANGKEVAKNGGDEVITYEDAQSVIRGILNQLPNDEVLLKVRFLADCFVASDKVRDVKFLKELLKSIKPRSYAYVRVTPNAFNQSSLLSILKLATGNKVADSEIKNAFSGIEFHINDLREMEILDYARWIDIDFVQLKDVNHFTEHQLMLVHRNVAFCGSVRFVNCKVPLFTTNANESTTRMKLKKLGMERMKIDQSESSSAANLFGLAEEVVLWDVRVGGNEFEKIVEKVIQIKPRRLMVMWLQYCPLVNHDLKQKMRENGVMIIERGPRSILLLCEPESRDFVLQLKEKLDDKNGYIAMDKNIEEFERQYNEIPFILVVFIQHQISKEIERDILFAQNEEIKILLVKLEADFHPSNEMSFVFDSNPCLDFTDKRNNAEMVFGLNRAIPAIIMDWKFIVISNAPGNQVEAIQIKQKFADEFGCPVFVNIKLWKYCPRVVVVLLTDGYEESIQCKEMMEYAEYLLSPNIIAVKLDSDFQPGDELNKIVRESTCICWTDETNFDTNFAKVKEEINAEFAW